MQKENEIEREIKSSKFNLYLSDEERLSSDFDSLVEILGQTLEILDDKIYLNLPVDVAVFNINLNLIGSEQIKEINNEHRGKNKATDVLSFPMQESIRFGEYDVFNSELEVGDILICHEVCEQQAQDFNIEYHDEFVHLFVHGLLHVFGYDHELNDEEDRLMRGLEDKILEELKKRRASI